MENKKLVYSTTLDHMAALIKGALEAEGISALELNQKDSAYTVFGQIELYVAPEDEEKAQEIISRNNG
mgnify:FL=1